MNGSENRRILVIDDTPAIHEDFKKILADQAQSAELAELEAALFGAKAHARAVRFQLDAALQGEEGLAMVRASLAEERPYALAFVDMRMPPGWDGVETIERLWEADPRLQVVICTAYSDYRWEEVLDRLEVGDRLLVLKKPFDAIEVCQLANTLTAKWQTTRQAESKLATLEEAVCRRTQELARANEALRADIAERRRAEEETLNAYRRISDVLDFLPDATFVVDAQGKVIAWNRAIEVMTGASKEEMLGQGEHAYSVPFYGVRRETLLDLLDRDPEAQQRRYPGARREGNTLTVEVRLVLRDEERFICASAAPFYDLQGVKVGAIESLMDVTGLRRSEQERSRLEAQLQHTSMIESLMTQLGHDLKTPLTPLFALLPMLRRQVNDPGLERMLEICQKSVAQMEGLSTKALELVRLSCQQSPLERAPLPLASSVDACINSSASLFSKRGVSCLNTVDHGVVVQASPEQLNLLLDNLLSNAARYAAENGTVRISSAPDGDMVVVAVHDDGIGLKPGQSTQIFTEFFKADPARQDVNTQGLGLAICRKIVLNHGGKIWAESPGPGMGTTVRFTLKVYNHRV